ncbi:hypothetical protein DYB31_015517, partial [Aphanomyces astaci]
VQRSSSQPRNIIPAYNPTLLLEAFAQNIEAKLALTQDLTKKVIDIERIKMELGDNVRRRVTRAMEAMREQIPPSAEPTTSVGTIPGMVEDLDHDTLNAERQIDYKKANDVRKPMAPPLR